jgi:ligand-binding sensor domain-containing protein
MSLAASGSHLFAGTYGGVFLSTDSGAHWTGTGLSPAWVNSLRLTDGNLFAGTDRGVFVSTDLGTTWNAASVGLTATFVFSLGISGGSLFVGTNSGAWGRPLQEMFTSIPVPLTAIPSRFSLQQNYPNPFNPSTSIRYSLQVRSHVTLSVFNTLGQLVSTVVNGSEEAGYHDVRFDASGLASGAYFYRLQARDFVQSKKLIVLR